MELDWRHRAVLYGRNITGLSFQASKVWTSRLSLLTSGTQLLSFQDGRSGEEAEVEHAHHLLQFDTPLLTDDSTVMHSCPLPSSDTSSQLFCGLQEKVGDQYWASRQI